MRRGYAQWREEFRHELVTEHQELMACARQRAGTNWSFDKARAATRAYFRDRLTGYCTCGSITPADRDRLLALVETLGTPDFREEH